MSISMSIWLCSDTTYRFGAAFWSLSFSAQATLCTLKIVPAADPISVSATSSTFNFSLSNVKLTYCRSPDLFYSTGSSGDTAVAEPILHVAEGPDKGWWVQSKLNFVFSPPDLTSFSAPLGFGNDTPFQLLSRGQMHLWRHCGEEVRLYSFRMGPSQVSFTAAEISDRAQAEDSSFERRLPSMFSLFYRNNIALDSNALTR